MKISRAAAYAVQAVVQLGREPKDTPVPASRLAAEGHMPRRFLLQVLKALVSNGILQSTRGSDGGYSLKRDLESISLLELIEAIDGPLSTTVPERAGLPPGSLASLQHALNQVTVEMRSQLSRIKLSQLPTNSRES